MPRPFVVYLLAAVLVLAGGSAVWASGASFVLSGKGIDLGKAEEVVENDKPLVRHHAKIEAGKPFTLTAQGMVFPRGAAKGSPSEPESGAWSFDEKRFEKATPEKKADKSEVVIALKPTATGKSRVRFTGKILGYERTFEVVIEVTAKKE